MTESPRGGRPESPTLARYVNPLLASPSETVEKMLLHVAVEEVAGARASTSRLFEGESLKIGSHESNDLVVDDPTVSRFHCRVTRAGRSWQILDRGSKNGTFVDGVKIFAAEIGDEALVRIGDSSLRVKPVREGYVTRQPGAISFGALVGKSPSMQRLYAIVERVAAADIDVLIHGESGTGKELVAAEIIQRGARADGPIIVVDCSAISPALMESEVFGHVRGAFGGADRDRRGALAAADRGTLFLDEIGELSPELQPKLLRALEAREVRPLGGADAMQVDVRVIAATHRDLEREVNRGRFREDLYYRLAKFDVHVPPLRDRLEDIPLLVRTFLAGLGGAEAASRLFPAQVLEELEQHDWPGNVRELKNLVERSVVLDAVAPPGRSGTMRAVSEEVRVDATASFRAAKDAAVAAFEKAYVAALLERCNGNVSQAAREARMDRMHLHQLAQKHGLRMGRRS